ncbi:MAG: chemotaxis protein CheW [Rhodospirillales bacterium]
MAKKISLREFQQGLVSRIQNATQATVTSTRLGVQAGPENWLLDLTDASEVVPLPALTPAPLTQKWFCGVVNVRGNLYSVVDFSAFQGFELTPQNVESRLLLVNSRYPRQFGVAGDAHAGPEERDRPGTGAKRAFGAALGGHAVPRQGRRRVVPSWI